jgi:hypothetical protein
VQHGAHAVAAAGHRRCARCRRRPRPARRPDCSARCATRTTMGSPPMSASGLSRQARGGEPGGDQDGEAHRAGSDQRGARGQALQFLVAQGAAPRPPAARGCRRGSG